MDHLVSWAHQHGASLHPAVEIFHDADSGNSFRVKAGCKLGAGETVVTCPMSTTLSYLNALDLASAGFPSRDPSSSPVFPSEFLASVPPHVVTRFFLVRQYLLGDRSAWHPYVRTLPQPDRLTEWGLPAAWPSDDVELLEGTNVHAAIPGIRAQLKAEHKQAATALRDAGVEDWRDYTRVLYHWAYCVFTSRSFRPSRVVPGLESLQLPEGCAIDDFQVLMPLLDVGNHQPSAKVEWDVEVGREEAGENAGLTSLRTLDDYGPGAQVFNHYGEKTNAELLLGYGFLVEEREDLHNDYVHVRMKTNASGSGDESGRACGAGGTAPGNDQNGIPGPSSGTDTEAQRAQEFFFSLRPFVDPSSAVGRKQSVLPNLETSDILPSFRHVQDRMVWELVCLSTTDEAREKVLAVSSADDAQARAKADEQRLRMVLTGQVPATFNPVLERVMALIQAKAAQELEKLEETHFEIEGVEGVTRNQRLAYEYRTRCMKVLVNVLESIEMPPA